jgi:HK97 family phage major capsid protein
MLTKEQMQSIQESFKRQGVCRIAETLPESYSSVSRSIRVVAASSKPTPMIDWDRWMIVDEILLMEGMELPAGRSQVPLLDAHNRFTVDAILGNARDFETVGDKKEATIHFSSIERAVNAETLAREGHLTDLSVGYSRSESFFVPEGEKQIIAGKEYTGPVKVTTKWMLRELSLVPIGADENAVTKSLRMNSEAMEELQSMGMRADADDRELLTYLKRIFETKPVGTAGGEKTTTQGVRTMDITKPADLPTKTADQILAEERQRVSEIEKIGKRFSAKVEKLDEMQRKAVDEGWTVDRFKYELAERVSNGVEPVQTPDSQLDLTVKETKRYSLLRLIQHQLDGRIKADFEIECSNEIAKRIGDNPQGYFIPWDIQNRDLAISIASEGEMRKLALLAERHGMHHAARALTSVAATGAAELVGTNLRADLFVELLRNRSISGRVGVTILNGLQGNLSIPRQTGASTWEWTGEAGTTTGSALTTGSISMTPKEGRAFQEYTRMLLLQSSPSIELLVQNDLLAVALLGIDKAVFHGSGSSNQPKGIANESGIGAVTGTDMGWDAVVEFETDVAVGNADVARMFYVTNASVRGLMKTRSKVPNFPQYLMDDNGNVNGYPSAISNQISSGYIFFGDFSPEILGYWGNLDVLVNPFAKDKEGITRVNIFADVDCALRQAASISVSSTVS